MATWADRVFSFPTALMRDVLAHITEEPEPGTQLLPHVRKWAKPYAQTEPEYVPDCGPRIHRIDPTTGAMEVEFRFYLPAAYGKDVRIRGSFTGGRWFEMDDVQDSLWQFQAHRVPAGGWYEFGYLDHHGTEQHVTDPMAYRYDKQFDPAKNQYSLYAQVPDLAYDMQHPIPKFDRGLVVFETTLPGLLHEFDGGRYRPRAGSKRSLADRVVSSGLIRHLRERGYNAVMAPIQACAADMHHFKWQFSYLINGLGAIDAQLGDWAEIKRMIDRFHGEGILFIPDLVLAHHVKQSSVRCIDKIVDAQGRSLWFDDDPHLFRDYGTRMINLADRKIRFHVAEMVVRFCQELSLGALRFDYVDGWMMQYAPRAAATEQVNPHNEQLSQDERNLARQKVIDSPANYGASLLRNVVEVLDVHHCSALRITEAFQSRTDAPVQALADMVYEPWVACVTLAALFGPPNQNPDLCRSVGLGVANSTVQFGGKMILSYALSHDEAGQDPHVLKARKEGRVEGSAGGHLAELVVEHGKKRCEAGQLPPGDLLRYTANYTLLIEALAMFSGNVGYLATNGCSDVLKLGNYDDRDHGWQVVWDLDRHPDLRNWVELTGLGSAEVRTQLAQHMERMQEIREIYLRNTPVDSERRRPLITIQPTQPTDEREPADQLVLVFGRLPEGGTDPALLIAVNLRDREIRHHVNDLPANLTGSWKTVFASPAADSSMPERWQMRTRTDGSAVMEWNLPSCSLTILQRDGR